MSRVTGSVDRAAARHVARTCGLDSVALVHRGAWFAIYRGRERGTNRMLAVKALRPGLASVPAVRQLRREARIRAAVCEPGLLPLVRVVDGDESPLVIGPWLEGGALAARDTPLAHHALARVIADVGGAIDGLHAAGWSHADVHRRNVLLTGAGRAVLTDLAAAQRLGKPWLPRSGRAPRAITPQIIPPEAWRGEPVDERGDVYALGVLLYRELTGRFPFSADTPDEYARLHCEADVPAPARIVPMAPEVERVLLRALARDPGGRPASGCALAEEFQAAIGRGGSGEIGGWSGSPGPDAGPAAGTLVAAGAHLERFAASLDDRERTALHALLARARAVEERAAAEVASMTSELFGVPAALLALERTGVAHALARGAQSVDELARALGLASDPLHALLAVLAAAGLVTRRGDRFALPRTLHALYLGPAATQPLDEALRMWTWLPALLTRGEPYLRMDAEDGARYAGVVHILGAMFEAPARQLAAALRPHIARAPAVLDLGAGSGVWSLAIAARHHDAEVTAVDRAAVLDSTRRYAETRGLGARVRLVPGDYHQVVLPPDEFDVILLANVCHLEPPDKTARLIVRAARWLRPGGRLIVVDTIPATSRSASLRMHLHTLRLQLRTAAGRLHDLRAYRTWMRAAGLAVEPPLALQAHDEGLCALIARRHGGRSPGRGQRPRGARA